MKWKRWGGGGRVQFLLWMFQQMFLLTLSGRFWVVFCLGFKMSSSAKFPYKNDSFTYMKINLNMRHIFTRDLTCFTLRPNLFQAHRPPRFFPRLPALSLAPDYPRAWNMLRRGERGLGMDCYTRVLKWSKYINTSKWEAQWPYG